LPDADEESDSHHEQDQEADYDCDGC
jgi:hypothetical protein